MKKNPFKKFFKPSPVLTLPYTLNRREIYILPTKNGMIFMVLLFAMLL